MRHVLQRNKRPSERFAIGIDFSPDLEAGEALTDAFTVKVYETSPAAFGTEVTNDNARRPGARREQDQRAHQGRRGRQGLRGRVHAPTDQGGDAYEHEILVRVRATRLMPSSSDSSVRFSEAIAAAKRGRSSCRRAFYDEIPEAMRQYAFTVTMDGALTQIQT
jgi:hypothetical protein